MPGVKRKLDQTVDIDFTLRKVFRKESFRCQTPSDNSVSTFNAHRIADLFNERW